MEKNIEISLLFDFYGELLKPLGKEMIDLYYNEDLSLAEIADQIGITRQGVRDRIKRCEQQLFAFENKLGLLKRFGQLESGLESISQTARKISEQADSLQTEQSSASTRNSSRQVDIIKPPQPDRFKGISNKVKNQCDTAHNSSRPVDIDNPPLPDHFREVSYTIKRLADDIINCASSLKE